MKCLLPNIVTIIMLVTIISPIHASKAIANYQSATYAKLDDIRQAKKSDILYRLNLLQKKALSAQNDPVLLKPFVDLEKYSNRSFSKTTWMKRMYELDAHYVQEYGEFYDILFISKDGLIFHSIKMEPDFMQNLFEGELSGSKLSKSLRKNTNSQFVDYDYYLPSKEPASFFAVEIKNKNVQLGWVVFQYSINAINSVLSDHKNLGKTGEIYLTNTDKIMITQSRLIPENTSLQLKVDTEAPSRALKETIGHMIFPDYRGVMVFSSYEKFEFAGISWVIIAEIDEDEVITEYYRENKDDLFPKLINSLVADRAPIVLPHKINNSAIRVDINEYAKALTREQIVTYGVATCMAAIVSAPEQFTYLGHVYPLDDSYRSGWDKVVLDLQLWLGGKTQVEAQRNLIDNMLTRIKRYDIYPYEISKLRVVLAAVHTKGFKRAIDILLDKGLFLSQITAYHFDESSSFNVTALGGKDIQFSQPDNQVLQNHGWADTGNTPNLAQHLKAILDS